MGNYYSSEQAFRIYEPIIIQAITAIPNAISFVTKDKTRKATTDAARCRDAISAWRVRRWPSPIGTVAALANDLRTWEYEGRCYIGNKSAHKEFHSTVAMAEAHNRPVDLSAICHYVLGEVKQIRKQPDPVNDPRVRRNLAFDSRITPRPLLRPKAFPTESPYQIPSAHDAVTPSTADSPIDTPQEPEQLPLSELIKQLDEGKITGQFPFEMDKMDEIKMLTAGRLNVAFGIRDGKIILF
jgi:hypothetical protein